MVGETAETAAALLLLFIGLLSSIP